MEKVRVMCYEVEQEDNITNVTQEGRRARKKKERIQKLL